MPDLIRHPEQKKLLDSGLCRNDALNLFLTLYEIDIFKLIECLNSPFVNRHSTFHRFYKLSIYFFVESI